MHLRQEVPECMNRGGDFPVIPAVHGSGGPTDRTSSAHGFYEDAQFSVRTLEKGAHLRRNRRDFPRCALSKNRAHLRKRCAPSNPPGLALDPVPLTRKVVLPLLSASIACLEMTGGIGSEKLLLSRLRRETAQREPRPPPQISSVGAARFCRSVSMREGPAGNEKSRALHLGTAPLKRD
jgi:hypothetical protein